MTRPAGTSTSPPSPPAMDTPPVVSAQEWEAARGYARQGESPHPRPRRPGRRAPAHALDGGAGKLRLRKVPRGRPACSTCSRGGASSSCTAPSTGRASTAGPTMHAAAAPWWPTRSPTCYLNARDTTLAFASRAPPGRHRRLKARMGWDMPWYTITDGFDADFGVHEWHGTNVHPRRGHGCSAPISSITAATNRWAAPGTTSTSPRWAARKTGKTRRPDIRRRRPTSGGTGTTAMWPARRPTVNGSGGVAGQR